MRCFDCTLISLCNRRDRHRAGLHGRNKQADFALLLFWKYSIFKHLKLMLTSEYQILYYPLTFSWLLKVMTKPAAPEVALLERACSHLFTLWPCFTDSFFLAHLTKAETSPAQSSPDFLPRSPLVYLPVQVGNAHRVCALPSFNRVVLNEFLTSCRVEFLLVDSDRSPPDWDDRHPKIYIHKQEAWHSI